jgi:hypothetical protein
MAEAFYQGLGARQSADLDNSKLKDEDPALGILNTYGSSWQKFRVVVERLDRSIHVRASRLPDSSLALCHLAVWPH